MGIDYYLLPQVSWISDSQFRRMRAALALSAVVLAEDYSLVPSTFSLASSAPSIPQNGVPMVFGATTDHPEFIAYHKFLDGRPYIFVLADQNGMTYADVCVAGSHEADETDVDPFVDKYEPLPSGGYLPKEPDDPVQADVIFWDVEGEQIAMSNHVTPEWYKADPLFPPAEDEPKPRLDAAGLCTERRRIRPGGYEMRVDAEGNVREIGAGPAGFKRSPLFRHGRRLVSLHHLAMRIRLGLL